MDDLATSTAPHVNGAGELSGRSWSWRFCTLWRMGALALLAVALWGPWAFDRINVPARYACSDPIVRLEGDFCGLPLSGTYVLAAGALASLESVRALSTGTLTYAEPARALLTTFFAVSIAFALILPFAALGFLFKRDRSGPPALHITMWSAAVIASVLTALLIGHPAFARVLWGNWLYAGVAACTLVLELSLLRAKRSCRPSNDLDADICSPSLSVK